MSEGFIIGNGGGGLAFGYIAALVPTDAESLICRMYANEQRTQLIGSIDGGAGIAAGQFLFHIPVRCWCEVEAARTLAGGAEETKTVNVNVLTRGKIERALMGWKVWLYRAGDDELFDLWHKTADYGTTGEGITPRIPDRFINGSTGMQIGVNRPSVSDMSNCGAVCLKTAIDITKYKTAHWSVVQSADSIYISETIAVTGTDPYNAAYETEAKATSGRTLDISNINGSKYIVLQLYTQRQFERQDCIINDIYLE